LLEVCKNVMNQSRIEKTVFWPSLILVVVATLFLVIFRETAGPVVSDMMTGLIYRLDWAFEFLTIGLFIMLIWLMLGRYGRVKLGDPEDKTEFSRFSWGGMLFCASMRNDIIL